MALMGATAFYIALIAYIFFRQQLISPGIVFSLSLLLPVLLFQVDLDFYASFVFSSSALLFYFCSLIGGALKINLGSIGASYVKSVTVYGVFAVGFAAFSVNIIRVFTELGLWAYLDSDSKTIELVFGRYTSVNYIFFMLMIVPGLALISPIKNILKILLVVISLICLTFNGIKSTFLFAFVITVFTYVQVFGVTLRRILLLIPIFFFAVTAMFVFVNMGGGFSPDGYIDLLYGYVGINYRNFELELNVRDDFTYGKYTFFFLTKLIDAKYAGGYYASTDFNLLNVDFNMGTVLREFYVDFGLLGMFFVISLLGFISGVIYKIAREYGGIYYILSSILLTACLFAFFGNQFIRLQFVWLTIVIALVHYISRYKYVWD